ncbi:hypothetical protein [Spiroplasma endosymbiont of Phyllotreta cruciferae]|uniref:hypothetical protein n=1 Tax=Spiroplasma endosymbiont of Phyllotreta cruciferae TaxID=2886375 RepID=UPI0020A028CC|nr:hypothetical protein [Spiroplasma endosymbiont of Phyllotreta cruciferae]
MKSKKYQVVIRNINVYLNKEQEKIWNELPSLYTHSQRVQHFINYYIVNESKKIMKMVKMNNYILCYRSEKGNQPCKTLLSEYITGTDVEDININSTEYW